MSKPGWFRDPSRRFHYRWWDGELWTAHVSVNGSASIDPAGSGVADPAEPPGDTVTPPPPTPPKAHGVGAGGDTRLFLRPYIRVDEVRQGLLKNSYQISSVADGPLGQVVPHGSLLSNRRQLLDLHHRPVLTISRGPAFSSRYSITDPSGRPIGDFVSRSLLGAIRYELTAHGHSLGFVTATSWTNTRFRISDARHSTIADIERPKSGLAELLSSIDSYTMTRYPPIEGPLQWLTLVAPVVIDRILADRRN